MKKTDIVYSAKWLAEKTGYSYHTVVVKLRAMNVKKDGHFYDFGNKKNAIKVATKIKAA